MKPMQSLPVRPTPYTPPLAHPIGRGFTAIELLIVIAVIAVLAALAGPSFTPIIERWRVRQAAEDLQASLYYARSEAIKRGGNVTITKSPNSSNCANASSNTQWGCGWTVDAGGTSLQQVAAPNRVAITLAGSSGSISVDRWGMLSHGSAVGTTVAMDFLLAPLGMDANNKSSLRLCTGVGGRIVQIKGSESCS
jgi:type IV fimbrial biogenesis protein FimT